MQIPSHIAERYISLVGSRLERFHQVKSSVWVFRCPICGDSVKQPWKTRGYIFAKNGNYFFKCHNCSQSLSFPSFMERVDSRLSSEFWFEVFRDNGSRFTKPEPSKSVSQFYHRNAVLDNCVRLDRLDASHPTFAYVKSRMLPERSYSILYSTDNWAGFVSTFDEEAAKKTPADMRLVIPVFDAEGVLVKCQGRAVLSESKSRYTSVDITPNRFAVFGEDRLVAGKTIWAFEGPLDSLFVDNGVAFTTLTSTSVHWKPSEMTIVLDNQPRNKDVVKITRRWLIKDYPVMIWPDWVKAKDLNQMVMDGEIRPNEISTFLQENACKGPTGLLQWEHWKKI